MTVGSDISFKSYFVASKLAVSANKAKGRIRLVELDNRSHNVVLMHIKHGNRQGLFAPLAHYVQFGIFGAACRKGLSRHPRNALDKVCLTAIVAVEPLDVVGILGLKTDNVEPLAVSVFIDAGGNCLSLFSAEIRKGLCAFFDSETVKSSRFGKGKMLSLFGVELFPNRFKLFGRYETGVDALFLKDLCGGYVDDKAFFRH